jgi:iron complex transport system substrate-binding protein
VVGGLVLAACGDGGDDDAMTTAPITGSTAAGAPVGTTQPSGAATTTSTSTGWSFTDDDGTTVELATTPTRIVMFEDVAASLMDLGVQPVGIHFLQGQDGNDLLADFDLTGIASTGNCSEANIEAAAALEPELFVYMDWGEPTTAAFCLEDTQKALLEEIAPVIRIAAEGRADEILERYVELAASLGADLEDPAIAAKRERYDAASARLDAAVTARPEMTVIPMSGSPGYAGAAEIDGFADLVTLRDRYGVSFVTPFSGAFTETYWQELSPETVTDLRADVILMDAKNATPLAAKLEAFPLWAALPEVVAGQIVPWYVPGSFSYTRDAAFLDALATAIESGQDLVP